MTPNETTRPVCSCCGAIIETDDYYEFDGSILCDDCYHTETVECSHCGDRIWSDDNAGSDSTPLCNTCYDDYYTTCECCGRIVHRDCANYDDDDDYAYCDRCYEERQHSSIHEYSYKPDPIFYGDSKRYFGVELEIDEGGKSSDNADTLLDIGNRIAEHIYIKSDGSLSDGMEIVTHPMSLKYHKNEMPWADIMRSAIHMYYRSHKTSTCGLHVHVNRTAFGATREAQEECIFRVLYFVEHHWLELLKFSRRTEYQMNRWAARYGYKNSPKEILEDAKKECNGRYACVNITNYHTIEFRMFRGTLKYNTLIATLELVDTICDIALTYTDSEISKISWTDFVSSLDEETCSELITYLKERQLYITHRLQQRRTIKMCAIFGLIDYNRTLNAKQRQRLLRVLSEECEERGTDATGYAFNHNGKLTIFKRPYAAHKVHLRLPEDSNVIMGHTRMATQGNKLDNRNNHPFPGKVGNTHFALAHNGVLHNDVRLRNQLSLPNTPVKTDSYIAVQLLEQQKTLDMKSISEMAELVEGSFVFTVLDEHNNVYFVKGDNPLALYHYDTCGLYVYASTEAILDRALTRLGIIGIEHQQIDTTCGDILKINSTGAMERGMFDTTNLMMYDYRYFHRDWWNVPEPSTREPQDVKQLKDFAASIGVARDDIDLLLSYGYFVEEIEEMLYQPGAIEEALCEILDECAYDYCCEF